MADRVLLLFSELLSYPSQKIGEVLDKLEDDLKKRSLVEVVLLLSRFREQISRIDSRKLEEIYTQTFDLNPAIVPYIGYHLFGESYKRGDFMSALLNLYRENGFEVDSGELPDHLTVVLRFLSERGLKDEEARELAIEGLLFALSRMVEGSNSGNPYITLLKALRFYLEKELEEARDD
jgi:nitrate reductase delta subunit